MGLETAILQISLKIDRQPPGYRECDGRFGALGSPLSDVSAASRGAGPKTDKRLPGCLAVARPPGRMAAFSGVHTFWR